MPITRKVIVCFFFLFWCWWLIWVGSQLTPVTWLLTIVFGFLITFDLRYLPIFARASTDQRSKPMQWMSVKVLMPRDGHSIVETDDLVGSVLEIRDLQSKQGDVVAADKGDAA